MANRPIYLDCNATTPLDPVVADAMRPYFEEEFGNAGSRTHEYGAKASRAVQVAREQVAAVVDAEPRDVVLTSGATESNNLALFGLVQHANNCRKRHIISTAIEHKSVLEPLQQLKQFGFEITLVRPAQSGRVEAADVLANLRDDTILVSVMHVNNETGVIQPLSEISSGLGNHDAYFHTDAAQGFGKDLAMLRDTRIDIISVSGHKIYGPKGIGALIIKRRFSKRTPLTPIMWGGGQERGLRPGTLPVPLVVGLGAASQEAIKNNKSRLEKCEDYRRNLLAVIRTLDPVFLADPSLSLPHVLNVSFSKIDSEAIILALKDVAAISNGSACTSASIEPSHVLLAMGYDETEAASATRWSWSHLTPEINPTSIVKGLATLT